jgi:tetratricopeptide (TPR) repeat protein
MTTGSLPPSAGEEAGEAIITHTTAILPILPRPLTIVLLALANLGDNAASLKGVIIDSEAADSPAPNVVVADKVQITNPSATDDFRRFTLQSSQERTGKNAGLPDTLDTPGIVNHAQSRREEVRKEYEEALKTYRELAEKEPETYLPYVAATLNNLGILDSAQNRLEEARKKYEEALKICRELAQKEPETYLPYVAAIFNNLGFWIATKTGWRTPGRIMSTR